ncbi:alpha/beta-hydrolase [Lophium mytilinum]|uniref:Alpha/beta-hydrolase n=1 Tax=Lophium mytilinum TaxID=390894 RepID=A0A6A6QXH5_9PEZI|nr:alpha/beta-hydrolase [Lophium mytilinum]
MELSNAGDDITTQMKPHSSTPIINNEANTIHITHRSERRFLTHVLHLILRPFNNHLGRPSKPHPPGSSPLHPSNAIRKHCSVTNRRDEATGIYIADLRPLSTPEAKITKHIYYFCGGGWQTPATAQHWQTCSKLARQMPNTAISIVSYPLAPNDPAPKAFPQSLALYRRLMAQSVEEGTRVILAGDSAGGNVVLAIVLEALREDFEADAETRPPCPVAIMAISPSTDLRRDNPEIEKIKKDDPILTPPFIKSTAQAWAAEWDPADPKLSPINADISLLARAGVKVNGITGGYDILGPDGRLFRDACAAAGVSGEWLDWDKQMHCFLLTWPYGFTEAREAMGWMVDVLKEV